MRAQSHVVGVTLLLGVTVVALGSLTIVAGTLLEAGSASADATRVAGELDETLRPVETTGPRVGQVHFAGGTLSTVQREIRIINRSGPGVITEESVGGLVFEASDRRVAYVGDAVVAGQPGSAWLESGLPITSSERNGVLVVGVPRLQAGDVTVGGTRASMSDAGTGGGTTVTLATNVSHDRVDLGTGNFSVAVETETPRPFERYFEAQNATVTRQDFDGDGVESVVAEYPHQRRGYMVVHNLSLEVHGG